MGKVWLLHWLSLSVLFGRELGLVVIMGEGL